MKDAQKGPTRQEAGRVGRERVGRVERKLCQPRQTRPSTQTFEGEVAGGVGVACDVPEPVLPVPPEPPVPDVGCDDVLVWPEPVPLPPEDEEPVPDCEGEVAVERDVPDPPEEPVVPRETVSG